jgi:hypothetical protein
MTDENIELTKKEIERLKEKIKLEKSNQEVIKKSIQDQTIANKSLIVAQEKLLAQAQKLPETTEAQLAAKNKQIESIELEIKRLKELGLTRDKDGNNVQASIERNIALADAQQKYMQGIRDNDFETADFAKHKMLLLEEEFNQEARRIQREFLEAKANDESLKENERVAAKQD